MAGYTNLHDIDPAAAVDLVVGWKSAANYHLRRVRLSEDVANEFRTVIAQTKDSIEGRERESWTPETDVSPETVLDLPLSELGPQPALTREHRPLTFIGALLQAADLPVMTPQDLPAASLAFYAFVSGNDTEVRTVLLRRVNPQRSLRGGRRLTVYRDVLRTIEGPVFGFDDMIDLVIHGTELLILSQVAFAAIFRDNDTLAARAPQWVAHVRTHVAMTDEGAARLTARALRDSRMLGRLEAIVHRGHLQAVTSPQLRDAMVEYGLDADRLVDEGGALLLANDDIPTMLQFLNEDLFVGALSSTPFRADRKHSR